MGKKCIFFFFGCAGSLLWCVGLSCYRAQTLEHMGSEIEAHGLLELWRVGTVAAQHVGSWFPDQGSNLSLQHWKVDSQPLDHQESPRKKMYILYPHILYINKLISNCIREDFLNLKCKLALSAFAVWDGVTQAKSPRGAGLSERAPDPRGRGHQPAPLPRGSAPAGGGQPAPAHGHPAVQHHAGTCSWARQRLQAVPTPPAEQQQMSHGLLFLALAWVQPSEHIQSVNSDSLLWLYKIGTWNAII